MTRSSRCSARVRPSSAAIVVVPTPPFNDSDRDLVRPGQRPAGPLDQVVPGVGRAGRNAEGAAPRRPCATTRRQRDGVGSAPARPVAGVRSGVRPVPAGGRSRIGWSGGSAQAGGWGRRRPGWSGVTGSAAALSGAVGFGPAGPEVRLGCPRIGHGRRRPVGAGTTGSGTVERQAGRIGHGRVGPGRAGPAGSGPVEAERARRPPDRARSGRAATTGGGRSTGAEAGGGETVLAGLGASGADGSGSTAGDATAPAGSRGPASVDADGSPRSRCAPMRGASRGGKDRFGISTPFRADRLRRRIVRVPSARRRRTARPICVTGESAEPSAAAARVPLQEPFPRGRESEGTT